MLSIQMEGSSEVNLITGKLKITPDDENAIPIILDKSEVTIIKDAEIRLNKEELKELEGLEDR